MPADAEKAWAAASLSGAKWSRKGCGRPAGWVKARCITGLGSARLQPKSGRGKRTPGSRQQQWQSWTLSTRQGLRARSQIQPQARHELLGCSDLRSRLGFQLLKGVFS